MSHGASVNAVDVCGATPLHHLAKGRARLALMLILAGADVNARTKEGVTPLHYAAKNEDRILMNVLTTQGAELDAADCYGKTPLHWAAQHASNVSTLTWLHSSGANMRSRDLQGKSALWYARVARNDAMISLMKQFGHQVSMIERLKCSWLHRFF